jgi:hypothetical protein
MKFIFFLGIFFQFFIVCCAHEIQIGDSKSRLCNTIAKTNRFALINPGTLSDLYYYKEGNMKYLLSFDKNDQINYIIVNNDNFMTSDFLKRGDTIEMCLERQGVLMVEEGVCFFVILKSGWFAYIEGINYDLNKMDDTKIKFFYKKDKNDNSFFMPYEEYKSKYETSIPFDFTLDRKIIINEIPDEKSN